MLFWNWLLDYLKLTAKTASLHDIYQQDCAAIFYDLDDDGLREIIGTHFATDISGRGSCYLYIIKSDSGKFVKYKLISGDFTFDVNKPIEIMDKKSGGYRNIRAKSQRNGRFKYFVFNEDKKLYLEK